MSVVARWNELADHVNGRATVGQVGVRDPEYPCEAFDGHGYDGTGACMSDGHYLCVDCSHLTPNAPRFEEHGRGGRRDRLLLYWRRKR